MGKMFSALAALTVIGAAACKPNQTAMNDDLAKDLASASSASDVLALAPTNAPAQTTISATERVKPTHTGVAASRKAAPHRAPHAEPKSPTVAMLPVSVSPDPVETPTAQAPRPQPVAISYPMPEGDGNSGIGSSGSDGAGTSGPSTGEVIGGIFGVVIRGGVGDVDHCDPRAGRGRPRIAINNRIPFPRRF